MSTHESCHRECVSVILWETEEPTEGARPVRVIEVRGEGNLGHVNWPGIYRKQKEGRKILIRQNFRPKKTKI